MFDIVLASPRGFCAGVDRALEIVNCALDMFDETIYVKHEIVHNKYIVDNLKKKGVIFVDKIQEIPKNSIVIFSAHGVANLVKKQAKQNNLRIFDATCPLVTKVHMQIIKCARKNQECIFIGHANHPEAIGAMGQYFNKDAGIYLLEKKEDIKNLTIKDEENLQYVSQTTLSVDSTKEIIQELKKRFPKIKAPRKDDICYATQNRQDAVKELTKACDLILVVGSKNSSNSNRLKEIAKDCGKNSYLIDSYKDINLDWLLNAKKVGISAGASAPDILVQQVIDFLKKNGAKEIFENQGKKETTTFLVPKELKIKEKI